MTDNEPIRRRRLRNTNNSDRGGRRLRNALTVKQRLGQFYTNNYVYILEGFQIPDSVSTIIEPFAGLGDLIEFFGYNRYFVYCYDIEPKKNFIIQRDTILNPPDYTNKYVITNPPYLARNKCEDKILFDKYDVNDLYKCFLKELCINCCQGGIIIIPVNFWCSIRAGDIALRKLFLEKYVVEKIKIFEEQVFSDTTYAVCVFQFTLRTNDLSDEISIMVSPSNILMSVDLNENNNYMIGGSIYKLPESTTYKISRLTSKNKTNPSTNIMVKCIDDNENSKIGLSFVEDDDKIIDETPNQSNRTYCTLTIEPQISIEMQKQLIIKFNSYFERKRRRYHSLFLSNYRESKDIARKRVSFDLIYLIVGYILDNFDRIN